MDLSTLPTAGELLPLGLRAPRWHPGLPCAPHSEVFASGNEASGAALALALALDGLPGERIGQRSVLWVQDKASLRLNGWPYRPGLPAALRGRVIHVCAPRPEDALFALLHEEFDPNMLPA